LHIFIDESGNFALAPARHSLSLVGALIVPEHKIDQLFSKYALIRKGLRKDKGEVKGRLLSEPQVARVVELIRKNSCIFEAVAIDMGLESVDGLKKHRMGQAEALTRHLTDQHQPTLIAGVKELRARLEAMPLPLYVQSQATIQLLGNILQILPAYWTLRVPKETLNFHWVIDGKDVGRVTNAEDWWSTTMLGLMQTRSFRDPMVFPDWVDKSAFDKKFSMTVPDYLREHIPEEKETAIDLKLIMKESFRFSSEPEHGLELADIVTNGTRRALMGNLGRDGWQGIPRLMIHTAKGQYVKLITLTTQANALPRPYAKLLATDFRRNGRSLLTPRC
jgi:hypothetical protein